MTSSWEEYIYYVRNKSMDRRIEKLFGGSDYPESDLDENLTEEEQEHFCLKIRSPLFSSIDSLASTIPELCVELCRRREVENEERILQNETVNAIKERFFGDSNLSNTNMSKSNYLEPDFESIPADSEPFNSDVASCGASIDHLLDVARIGSEASDVLSLRSAVLEQVDTGLLQPPAPDTPARTPSGYQRIKPRDSPLFSPLYEPLPELLVEFVKEKPDLILAEDFLVNFHKNVDVVTGKEFIPSTIRSDQGFSKCDTRQPQIPQHSHEKSSHPVVPQDIPQIRISESTGARRSEFTQLLATQNKEMSMEGNTDAMFQTVVSKGSTSANANQPQVPQKVILKPKEIDLHKNKTEIPKQFERKEHSDNKSKTNRKKQKTERFYERRQKERERNINSSHGGVLTSPTHAGAKQTDELKIQSLTGRKRKSKDNSQKPKHKKRFKIYKLCYCENHVCE